MRSNQVSLGDAAQRGGQSYPVGAKRLVVLEEEESISVRVRLELHCGPLFVAACR